MEGAGAVDRIEISGEEGLKMEKKGILVVSFGTSHLDTMAKTIQVMEEAQPTGESAGYSDEIYVKNHETHHGGKEDRTRKIVEERIAKKRVAKLDREY